MSLRLEPLAKVAALAGSLIAFAWGLYQYHDARTREVRKPYLELQLNSLTDMNL